MDSERIHELTQDNGILLHMFYYTRIFRDDYCKIDPLDKKNIDERFRYNTNILGKSCCIHRYVSYYYKTFLRDS